MSQIHVFDTYATTANGRIMHFDVVVTEKNQELALRYAQDWLTEIGLPDAKVSPQSCCYCHSEAQAPQELSRQIESQGYAIYKLEGCPS